MGAALVSTRRRLTIRKFSYLCLRSTHRWSYSLDSSWDWQPWRIRTSPPVKFRTYSDYNCGVRRYILLLPRCCYCPLSFLWLNWAERCASCNATSHGVYLPQSDLTVAWYTHNFGQGIIFSFIIVRVASRVSSDTVMSHPDSHVPRTAMTEMFNSSRTDASCTSIPISGGTNWCSLSLTHSSIAATRKHIVQWRSKINIIILWYPKITGALVAVRTTSVHWLSHRCQKYNLSLAIIQRPSYLFYRWVSINMI